MAVLEWLKAGLAAFGNAFSTQAAGTKRSQLFDTHERLRDLAAACAASKNAPAVWRSTYVMVSWVGRWVGFFVSSMCVCCSVQFLWISDCPNQSSRFLCSPPLQEEGSAETLLPPGSVVRTLECCYCGKFLTGTLHCSRCKSAYYCGRECQKLVCESSGSFPPILLLLLLPLPLLP